MKIKKIRGMQVLDPLGFPALECQLFLENDLCFKSKVALGSDAGRYQAFELKNDHGELAIQKSINIIENIIAPVFIGKEPDAIQMDLDLIDLDSNSIKANLGASTTLAVSKSVYRAQAHLENIQIYELVAYIIGAETVSIPIPILSANKYLGIPENRLNYLIIPVGAQDFADSLNNSFRFLRSVNQSISNSDQKFNFNQGPLEALGKFKEFFGYHKDFFLLGLDANASLFFDPETRLYQFSDDIKTTQQLIDWYIMLVQKYNLYYIEDPIYQEDFISWAKLMDGLGDKSLIVGQNIFSSNINRVVKGLESFCVNGVVIKPGHIGTVTETIQVIKLCKEAEVATVLSCRNTDIEDDFDADLAVGVSSNFVKFESSSHTAMARQNRLLEIENYLTSK